MPKDQGWAGEENRGVPVSMLTARDDEASVVAGLEVGTDDLRQQAVRDPRAHQPGEGAPEEETPRRKRLRATTGASPPVPGTGDRPSRQVGNGGGRKAELTPTEFDLLTLLASSPGRVYSRRQIMEHLWDGRFFGVERVVDVHVRNVRRKIEPDPGSPRFLFTVRGVGYKFVAPSEERANPTD